jgi:type I restriction enzyme S subunit
MAKFAEIFDFQRKSGIKAGDGLDAGKYFFYTSSTEQSKFLNEYLFDSDALIFGTGGNASVHFADQKFAVSTDCLVAQPKDKKRVHAKFYYYFLKGNMRILEKGFKGAGLKHISKSYISEIEFPEVDYEQQKKIVDILDRADALHRKRKQSLQLLDDFLRATFLDMFGDPLQNNKKFETVELKDLCSHVIDCPHSTPKYTDSNEGYACIRSSDLQNGFLDLSTTKFIDQEQYKERIKRCKPLAGDIIYCREGTRFGVAGYVPEGIDVCLGQRTMLFRAAPNKATPECLWGIIVSDGISYQASQLVGGAASPHVNVKDIKKYKAFCPPLELQKKYSQIFKNTMSVMRKIRQAFVEMDNQFNALTQRYFG